MNPVQRALWYVESHSREEILLEDIAAVCGVSPYHLTRTFATSPGLPLMRYVRGRRLSEAAKTLEGKFDYMCCVEVQPQSELPQGLVRLKVPSERYAVFSHKEHIASIRGTFSAIWNWFPSSNLKPADGPTMEVYTRDFDPTTGLGGLEIWIPVDQRA